MDLSKASAAPTMAELCPELSEEAIKEMGGMFTIDHNLNAPVGSYDSVAVQKVGQVTQVCAANAKKGKMFVVKLQVPGAGAHYDGAGMGIRCYDTKRKLDLFIKPSNCGEHDDLASTIRKKGLVGGGKAYCNAYITPNNELKIMYHELLPMQPW